MARAALAVPGHGLFAVLMGYYFSLARFYEGTKRNEYIFKSLALPIIFHGAYDFLLFYMGKISDNIGMILILLIIFAWLVIKLWRRGIHKIKMHLERDGKMI